MQTTVAQIKDKLDIVAVIGSYLKLEPAGINWKANCPFHTERTASFFVSPTRQSFYCFGCQKGGDLISFVEQIEGLDFMGALRLLAERAGVKLGPTDYHRERVLERSYQALEAAATYYAERLSRASATRDYLKERGLSEASLQRFRLGLAGSEWQGLANHLKEVGNFSPAELVAAGLAIEKGGRHYDRFRERIIFPLFDRSGRVVSLAGRVQAGAPPDQAKYINGPETVLYHKSETLYGYHLAREAIRQAKQAVLVEGYLDLIMAHQAGLLNAVAVSGTALTAAHLTPLKHLAATLVLAFDGDEAGRKAALRAAQLGLGAGFEVTVASCPPGQDPADLALANPEAFKSLITQALPAIDWQLAAIKSQSLSGRSAIRAVEETVYPLLGALKSRLDRAHYAGRIAALTGLRDETIEAELGRFQGVAPAGTPAPAMATAAPPSRQAMIGRHLLGLWWWRQEPADWQTNLVEQLAKKSEAEREAITLAAELQYGALPPEKLNLVFSELLSEWQKEEQNRKIAEIQKAIKAAEAAGDDDLKNNHLAALQQIYEAHKKTNQKTKN